MITFAIATQTNDVMQRKTKTDPTMVAVWLLMGMSAFFFSMWLGAMTEPDLIQHDTQRIVVDSTLIESFTQSTTN